MDVRLSRVAPVRTVRSRGLGFAILVLAVALVHAWLTGKLAERMAEFDPASAMPKRIEVAYVRTLEIEAPKPLVPVAPPSPARSAAPRVARSVEASASQPVPKKEPVPDTVATAAPVAEPAAGAASVPADEPVAVAAASAPAAAASASTSEGFVWPTATRVSYVLTGNWRGDLNGRAEVEWIRVDQRYQVNIEMSAGPEFAPLLSRRMTSEGRIVASGLAPDRYDEDTKVAFRDGRRVSVVFAPEMVTLGNGQQRERLAGVQDTASQFIQFTWMFGSQPERLRVGNSFEFPLALPRSMNTWTYDVAEEEVLHTQIGPLATFHLKPRRVARRPGEWLVEMWFAPELRYLPVRIHIEQDAGTFVDLLIAKKPEISGS